MVARNAVSHRDGPAPATAMVVLAGGEPETPLATLQLRPPNIMIRDVGRFLRI
jgi:hypothetical protein